MEVSKELQSKYNHQYSERTEKWRSIGALGKVENIIDIAQKVSFDNLIDVGAGDGNILSLLSEKNFCTNYTAAEISESGIAQIQKKSIKGLDQIVRFDGYTLPFEDKKFDLAICSHVIEHVEFPRKLLREIKRVSQYQILEIPIDFSFHVDKKFEHFYSYGHINIYTPALFNFLLLSEGFEILDRRHRLYRKEAIDFDLKKKSIKYMAVMLKRFLWKSIPLLMKLKPETYTVLCR